MAQWHVGQSEHAKSTMHKWNWKVALMGIHFPTIIALKSYNLYTYETVTIVSNIAPSSQGGMFYAVFCMLSPLRINRKSRLWACGSTWARLVRTKNCIQLMTYHLLSAAQSNNALRGYCHMWEYCFLQYIQMPSTFTCHYK